jgi:GNAT superfamily N-acetyltransferase
MGYGCDEYPFGWCRIFPDGQRVVILKPVTAGRVEATLIALRKVCGEAAIVDVDSEEMDVAIGDALVQAGLKRGDPGVGMAHVGPVPSARPVPGLTLEDVTADNVRQFSITKLMGFASSEDQPSEERIEHELVFRNAEMGGGWKGLLARLEREPVAICCFYEGTDRDVSLLATRAPFRKRGIATALLCNVLESARERECRSVVIGTNPHDTPIILYRSLGFTDEVGWRRPYRPA